MEYMRILVIGSHSHCNDCDTTCVVETEHKNSSKYSALSSHSGKAVVGFKLSDRTLVVSSLVERH